jgi:hypothetical protein
LGQEIFPNSQRSRGVSIVASINWMFNFIIGLTTKDMLGTMKYGTYIFAIFSALGGLFIWKFSPETKDKTLEELGVFFGGDRTALLEPIVCARCGPTKALVLPVSRYWRISSLTSKLALTTSMVKSTTA